MKYQDPSCYLPHDPPMLLIDEVLKADDTHCQCLSIVSPKKRLAPFLNSNGSLPSLVGTELIFQCIGVYSGILNQRLNRSKISVGMALGMRDFKTSSRTFAKDSKLLISVDMLMNDDSIGCFYGCIKSSDHILCRGRFTVYRPSDDEIINLCSRDKKINE